MKLLFAIKSLDIAGGGAERVLTLVVSGLVERGHEIGILSFDTAGGNSFYPLDARVQRICLGLGAVDAPTGAHMFTARVGALRRKLLEQRPDVAVGFMHSMFVPLSFAAVGLRIPHVASEHTVPEYYRGRSAEYALFVAGGLLSQRITVLSPAIRDMYPRVLRSRMVPIPNPVVTPAHAANVADSRIILAVGSLEAHKDHASLIDAFALIAAQFPDWGLRIIGNGSLRGELEARVHAHHLEERISMPGVSADIATEYAAAAVLAVPSRFESFGMAAAEALATGVPVIGYTDCTGIRELVTHGRNGWLVSGPDRVHALANALSRLMGDDALRARLGSAGPQVMDAYTPDRVVSLWNDMLVAVGNARRQP